jgi:hypothetical protein
MMSGRRESKTTSLHKQRHTKTHCALRGNCHEEIPPRCQRPLDLPKVRSLRSSVTIQYTACWPSCQVVYRLYKYPLWSTIGHP